MAESAAIARIAGLVGWRVQHATTNEVAASPAMRAATDVIETVTAAPGTAAVDHAIQSNAKRSGCTASANSLARAVNGAATRARNRIGCASVIIGAATRFETGAIKLIRPKTHATSGAVTAHATSEVISSRASFPLHPSRRL